MISGHILYPALFPPLTGYSYSAQAPVADGVQQEGFGYRLRLSAHGVTERKAARHGAAQHLARVAADVLPGVIGHEP